MTLQRVSAFSMRFFFTNDLWLFDPATDYMIRMLPEGFFADMVLRIALTFVVLLLAIKGVFVLWRVFSEKISTTYKNVKLY